MTLVENPPRRSDGKPRTPRWLLISAAAAVVVIVLGALVVADRDESTGVGTNETPVATSAPAPGAGSRPDRSRERGRELPCRLRGVRRGRGRLPFLPRTRMSQGSGTPPIGGSDSSYMQATGLEFMVERVRGAGHLVRRRVGAVPVRLPRAPLRASSGSVPTRAATWISPCATARSPRASMWPRVHPSNGFSRRCGTRFAHGSPPRIPTTSPPCTWRSMTAPGNGSRPTRSRCGSSALRSTCRWRRGPYVAEATQICRAATDRLVGSSDGAGADTERAARLAEQSLAELRSLPLPEGDAALASRVDQLIARSGQYIDVLNQIASIRGCRRSARARRQAGRARRCSWTRWCRASSGARFG